MSAGGGVVQGRDAITSAMESNIIPDQEYLLQGSILDGHVDVLAHRLRGLCDNVMPTTSGNQADANRLGAASGAAEPFEEREMVYTIRSGSPGGMQGQQPAPLSLRIRKQGTESPSAKDSAATLADTFALGLPKTPWQMRYLGQPEISQQRSTVVRSCHDIACSDNAVEFLLQLGFRLDFEFVSKGFIFRKGRMKITISKIFKILSVGPNQPQPPANAIANGPTEALEPLSGSHLVELSVLAPSGSDAIAEDMKNFAEQLRPLVSLDKIGASKIGFS